MITPNLHAWEPGIWQAELKRAYRSCTPLLADLNIKHPAKDAQHSADASGFPILVTHSFAARMRPGDLQDPLLRQVLANRSELEVHPGDSQDPLGETDHGVIKAPGLIQKYHGRALLIATPGCAIHCRYCFRRHFPYSEHKPQQLDQALTYLAQDSSINEVILSGGDPLLLNDATFASLLLRLNAIEHIQRIRIHSRLPIVLPARTTAALMTTISHSRANIVLVVHCNHPHELNADTARAIQCWRAAGTNVLNQTVLLRGVNNTASCLVNLSELLFEQGALPYYVNLPDRVQGTQHFQVNMADAQVIYREMQAQLPGYLLPKLVQERPGDASKRLIAAV